MPRGLEMSTLDPRLSQGGAVVLMGAVVVLSWQYGYGLAVRTYARQQARMHDLTQQITQVEHMVWAAGGRDAWLASHQRRLIQLRTRLPRQEQLPQLVDAAVETLRASDLHVLNVAQGNLEVVPSVADSPALAGASCHRLRLAVAAEGRYQSVLDALEQLTRETFPGVVTLDAMKCHLTETAGATLDITLQLSLYVIGTPSASQHPG